MHGDEVTGFSVVGEVGGSWCRGRELGQVSWSVAWGCGCDRVRAQTVCQWWGVGGGWCRSSRRCQQRINVLTPGQRLVLAMLAPLRVAPVPLRALAFRSAR